MQTVVIKCGHFGYKALRACVCVYGARWPSG